MKLFKYEGFKITIEPEALLLKPFRAVWKRDKSKNKEKALLELGFIYFCCDPRSDYQYIVDVDDRIKAIIEGEGLDPSWFPDKVVKEAMDFYEGFKTSSSLLLEDTRFAVDKLRKLLRDIDLTATTDKGAPVYTLNSITATIKQIPALVRDLDNAERAVASEMLSQGKMRGQGEKTICEDDIII